MEYTGKYKRMYSQELKDNVSILEYKSKHKLKVPYCYCDKCGKPIINKLFVVQSTDTALIYYNLGSECVKKFK